MGLLERIRDRRRKAYWVYRKAGDFKNVSRVDKDGFTINGVE
jgi:hypothetical protein